MPSIFLYIPFPDVTNDPVISELTRDLRRASMDFSMIDDDHGGNFLANVGDDDLLLIGSHGLENSSTLFIKGANGLDSITANTLADRISNAGLPKKHESILSLSCSAGGAVQMKQEVDTLSVPASTFIVDYGTPNAAGGNHVARAPYKCLASVLAKALGQRGYRNILVGGFPGAVGRLPGSGKFAFNATDVDGGDTNILAEIDHIQWFDASGRTTAEVYDRVSDYSRR